MASGHGPHCLECKPFVLDRDKCYGHLTLARSDRCCVRARVPGSIALVAAERQPKEEGEFLRLHRED